MILFYIVKVKSTTVQGSRNHPRENVKANVIRANIPVANGVVHLIDKPLIIIASPLWDYLKQEVTTNKKTHMTVVSYIWPVHLLGKDSLPSARRQSVFGYPKQSATVSVGSVLK
jgi:hypothetical protein